MRIIKAKVYVDRSSGNTTYIYPKEWLDNTSKFPSILYPSDRTDDGVDANGTYQFVFPILEDDVASLLMSAHPDEFVATTIEEVTAYSTKHSPQRVIVSDQNKAIEIVAKALLNGVESLTQEEKDAIDPSTSKNGIVTTTPWTDIITQYGATF